jgi:hypothetical protein
MHWRSSGQNATPTSLQYSYNNAIKQNFSRQLSCRLRPMNSGSTTMYSFDQGLIVSQHRPALACMQRIPAAGIFSLTHCVKKAAGPFD